MLKTRYITIDDFREYFQIDLREQLGSEASAQAFLKRVENRLERYIDANFNKNLFNEYTRFTECQKDNFKLALLEETNYLLRNSDLFVDSGYDVNKGIIADYAKLERLAISKECYKALLLCGLTNRGIGGIYASNKIRVN